MARRRMPADALHSTAEAGPTLAEALEQGDFEAPAPVPTVAALEQPPEERPTGVSIAPGIFRAYDIRGVVGDTLSRDVAELIGQAIGTVMHDKGLEDIVVGRDGRLSATNLRAAED